MSRAQRTENIRKVNYFQAAIQTCVYRFSDYSLALVFLLWLGSAQEVIGKGCAGSGKVRAPGSLCRRRAYRIEHETVLGATVVAGHVNAGILGSLLFFSPVLLPAVGS